MTPDEYLKKLRDTKDDLRMLSMWLKEAKSDHTCHQLSMSIIKKQIELEEIRVKTVTMEG